MMKLSRVDGVTVCNDTVNIDLAGPFLIVAAIVVLRIAALVWTVARGARRKR